MIGRVVEFACGSLIVGFTLFDVFSTILVPGPSAGRLRAAARLIGFLLPVARRLSRGRRSPGTRPGNGFAPVLFVLASLTWLLLLLLGYTLMFHALRHAFEPAVDFWETLYLAGSSLLTLGVSEVDARGAGRWLILAAALSGFGVITATISFIMQIQAGLHQREPRVLTLVGLGGRPPSGIALLETYARLGIIAELPGFFREWRDWAANLLHSHASYPVLAYFHSVDAESDWLASLEAVLDAATLLIALTEDTAVGAATLMHRSGSRTAAALCSVFQLDAVISGDPDEDTSTLLRERLAGAGYTLRQNEAWSAAQLTELRRDYAPRIKALSRHLGADRTRLMPRRR